MKQHDPFIPSASKAINQQTMCYIQLSKGCSRARWRESFYNSTAHVYSYRQGQWQKIRYSQHKGPKPYITKDGARLYLDEFYRL